MQVIQLELTLWNDLDQATAAPETADITHLWEELEQLLVGLPGELKLQTAGKAIAQIAEVFALRSDSLLSAWEESHNDEGPAVPEDAIAPLVRQSMSLDLSELMEQPVLEQRQSRSQTVASLAGPVDKATLLEAFNSEINAVESEDQREAGAISAAHEEDIAGWAGVIARWFAEQESAEPVSLIELQQALKMPMVEVWMGLLLSQSACEFKQHGDFYNPHSVQVSAGHLSRYMLAMQARELRDIAQVEDSTFQKSSQDGDD